jgi:hypothetical protein
LNPVYTHFLNPFFFKKMFKYSVERCCIGKCPFTFRGSNVKALTFEPLKKRESEGKGEGGEGERIEGGC